MSTKTKRPKILTGVLFGQTRGSILGLLFGHPDERYYFQQIRREIGAAGVGAVQRELETLVEVGILVRSALGSQVFFQANRSHPIFPELRALLAKTVGVFQLIQSALDPLVDGIRLAFVYGSLARQEETAESDVDLVVVGRVELEEVLEQVAAVEKQIGRLVNPTVYSSAEFRAKLAGRNHFVNTVVHGPKVFIIGDEDELAGLGRTEAAQSRGNKHE